MLRPIRYPTAARQRGATLVIALLILVLIMMLGITAISTSNTQYKLAGNLQFEDSAVNNTETAITTAERALSDGATFNSAGFTTYDSATTPHLQPIGRLAALAAPNNGPLTMAWDDTNSRCVGTAGVTCSPGGDPSQRYFIELMSRNNRLQGSSVAVGGRCSAAPSLVNTYLITARGLGARGAIKYVQSYYSVLIPGSC